MKGGGFTLAYKKKKKKSLVDRAELHVSPELIAI